MCDTFVALFENKVIFGKNSDRDPNEAQVINYLPRRHYQPNSTLRCTWRSIPQVETAYSIIISRPFWMWGAEMGVNEHGVAIGNEAVFTDQPLQHDGLTGMDLLRLALERSTTAAEAVEVIRSLIARYGQGGRCGYADPGFRYHNSFLIADYRGAFVLESAHQKTVTEKVSHQARAISNGLTIGSICGHSDPIRSKVAQCKERRHRVEELAATVQTPLDAMKVLRDHGHNHQWPEYRWLNGAMSAPCMHAGGFVAASQTVGSWVSELTPGGAKHWATGTAAPCFSVFQPVTFEETWAETPEHWWSFEELHRSVIKAPKELTKGFLQERDSLESSSLVETAQKERIKEWVQRWKQSLTTTNIHDERPRWLRRYWESVAAQELEGARMPPRRAESL